MTQTHPVTSKLSFGILPKSIFVLFWLVYCPKYFAQDSTYVDNLNNEALNLAYSDITKSLQKSREAIAVSQKIGYCKGEVKGYIRVGIAYDVASKFDSSYMAYKIANKVIEGCPYSKGIYSINNNLGLLEYKKKNLNAAASNFFKAYSEAQNMNDGLNSAIIANNIGLVFMDMKQFSESEVYFKKALDYYQFKNILKEQGSIYNNLSLSFDNQGNFAKAFENSKKAIQIHKEFGNTYGESMANINAGNFARQLNLYSEAVKYHLRAIQLNTSIKNYFGLASSHYNLGGDYNAMKDSVNAILELGKALKYAKKIKDFGIMKKAQADLAKIYLGQGKNKTAQQYLTENKTINIKTDWEIEAKMLAEASSKFKTDQAQLKSSFLERETKIKEKNLARVKKSNFLLATLFLITVSLFIGFLILAKTNASRKAKTMLLQSKLDLQEMQNEERTRISMDLHDNLGSQLAYVTGKLDILEMKKEMNGEQIDASLLDVNQMSKQAIATLRETVWALAKENTTLNQLISRFEKFAKNQLELTPHTQFELYQIIKNEAALSSQTALNIYRIIQESFNNAIRHSEASLITLTFEQNENALDIVLKDNGIGFSRSEADAKNHFGLHNIEARVKAIQGQVSIDSENSQGTTLKFRFSI